MNQFRLALPLALAVLAGCSYFHDQEEAVKRVCGPDVEQVPWGRGVEIGHTYSFDVLTHCGIEWAYFKSLLGAPEENGRAQHVGSDRARDDDSRRARCGSLRRYFSWEGRFRAGAPSATNPRPAPSERGSRASPSRCGPVFVLERDPRNPQHPVLTRRRRSFAGKSWAKFSAQCVSPEKTKAHMCRRFRSSPGWTRTNNPPVNSRMLCQLSYRGTAAPV